MTRAGGAGASAALCKYMMRLGRVSTQPTPPGPATEREPDGDLGRQESI